MARKNRSDDERFYQKEFIKTLKEFSESKKISLFIEVDEDSPMRVKKSGFDFFVSLGGKVIFIETKVSKAKTENYNIFNTLEDYQKITMVRVLASGGVYMVLEWNYFNKTFIAYLVTLSSKGIIVKLKETGIVKIMEKILDWLGGK